MCDEHTKGSWIKKIDVSPIVRGKCETGEKYHECGWQNYYQLRARTKLARKQSEIYGVLDAYGVPVICSCITKKAGATTARSYDLGVSMSRSRSLLTVTKVERE
jgi:hypothetical protein